MSMKWRHYVQNYLQSPCTKPQDASELMTSRFHWNPVTIGLLAFNTVHKRSYLITRLHTHCWFRHQIIDTEWNSSFWRQPRALSILFYFSTLLQKKTKIKILENINLQHLCQVAGYYFVSISCALYMSWIKYWIMFYPSLKDDRTMERLVPTLSTLWTNLSLANRQEIFMSFKDCRRNSHYTL